MRNLKRALSLALASVMLMGMMVVGSSAKDFTDADKIDNKEAVAITTGLGIFDGRDDGSFGAKDVVTRAEAAVVIAKILHGADVDPSNFVGTTKFTDVPAWAEGWVNLAASLNIIVGYGDGKFGPNDPVTTVQFTTMLLKALGYYTFDGALDADWALTVTSKATALGMYGDLVLPMNEGLTRENVAQLTWNALWEQRVAYEDYRGIYVKSDDRNVVVTNGTEDDTNTLADDVFGLIKHEDLIVTANGGVSVALAEDGMTVLECTNKEHTEDCEFEYNYEFATGLDMIGHAASVYYTVDAKGEKTVYAIVDEATLAVETTFKANLTDLAKENGFNRDTKDTEVVYLNDMENVIVDDDKDIKKGTPIMMISNNNDKKVDTIIVLDQYLEYVSEVEVNDANEDDITVDYTVSDKTALTEGEDTIVIGEVKEGDFIIVTKALGGDVIIEAAKTELVFIDEIDRNTATGHVKLYADGTALTSGSTVSYADLAVADFQAYAEVKVTDEYIAIYDLQDRVIGVVDPEEAVADVNAAYVAAFGYKINTEPSLKDAYRATAAVYFADGTNGVYYINTKAGLFKDLKVNEFGDLFTKKDEDAVVLGADYIEEMATGLYDVKVNEDKTITLKAMSKEIGEDGDKIEQIKSKVTKLGDNVYANSKTQFWFVNGTYGDDMTVEVKTGIKNVPTVFVKGEKNVVVDHVYNTNSDTDTREIAETLVIFDFELDTAEEGVYVFTGKYTIKKVAGSDKHTVTYKLYDVETGKAATLTYTYADYDEALAAGKYAAANLVGFVKDGGTKANALAGFEKAGYNYGVKFVDYEKDGDEITVYTEEHGSYDAKIMDDETIFVDLTGNGLEDLGDVEATIKSINKSWTKAAAKYEVEEKTTDAVLAYVYSTKSDVMSIIFVVDFTVDAFDLDLHDVELRK